MPAPGYVVPFEGKLTARKLLSDSHVNSGDDLENWSAARDTSVAENNQDAAATSDLSGVIDGWQNNPDAVLQSLGIPPYIPGMSAWSHRPATDRMATERAVTEPVVTAQGSMGRVSMAPGSIRVFTELRCTVAASILALRRIVLGCGSLEPIAGLRDAALSPLRIVHSFVRLSRATHRPGGYGDMDTAPPFAGSCASRRRHWVSRTPWNDVGGGHR